MSFSDQLLSREKFACSLVRDHSLFMPGGGLARIRRGGHANFRTVQGGGYEEIGVQEGGCLILQFFFFQRNVFIVVGSFKWYMISSV